MAAYKWLGDYAAEVAKIYERGGDTEGTYRTAIQNMLEAAAKDFAPKVIIQQEPERAGDLGSPDFRVLSEGGGIVGYVECKTPGANLHKLTTKAQIKKYRALSENILLTDSFRWLRLRDGNAVADVRLSENEVTALDFAVAAGHFQFPNRHL